MEQFNKYVIFIVNKFDVLRHFWFGTDFPSETDFVLGKLKKIANIQTSTEFKWFMIVKQIF